MDLVAAVPQEVAAIADITPIAYFAFLGGSVAFALGTVSTPSTIPPPRVAPDPSHRACVFASFLYPHRLEAA